MKQTSSETNKGFNQRPKHTAGRNSRDLQQK